MRLLRSGMDVPEAHRVAHIAVVDVRRIVRELRRDRAAIGIALEDHRRVADDPCGQKELLQLAFDALAALVEGEHWLARRIARAIGEDHRPQSRDAVVDAHAVSDRADRIVFVVELSKGLVDRRLIMEDGGEFAERQAAIGRRAGLQRWAVLVFGAVLLDDRVEIRMNDLIGGVDQAEARLVAPLPIIVDDRRA